MKLDTWHERPNGCWSVSRAARGYHYAVMFAGRLADRGAAPFACLARRRALAALRRMAGEERDRLPLNSAAWASLLWTGAVFVVVFGLGLVIAELLRLLEVPR